MKWLLLWTATSAFCSPLIEVKAGYFFFVNKPMNDVYTQGGLDTQLSFSYPVYSYLHVYSSVEYLEKSGVSLQGRQKTSLWQLPLSLGIRPVFSLHKYIAYYATLGPRYFFVYVHNHSSFVPRHMSAQGLGGFVNTGFLVNLPKGVTLDIFGEYSWKKLYFSSHKPNTESHGVQVGGVSLGGGIGYAF